MGFRWRNLINSHGSQPGSWSLFTLAWWTRFRKFLCAVSRCEAVVLGDVLARRRYLQLARCSLGGRIVSDQQSHAGTE